MNRRNLRKLIRNEAKKILDEQEVGAIISEEEMEDLRFLYLEAKTVAHLIEMFQEDYETISGGSLGSKVLGRAPSYDKHQRKFELSAENIAKNYPRSRRGELKKLDSVAEEIYKRIVKTI